MQQTNGFNLALESLPTVGAFKQRVSTPFTQASPGWKTNTTLGGFTMKEREGRCYNSSFCTFPCLLPGGPTVPSGLPPCQVCVVQVALSECCWPRHWENAGLSRLFRGWQGTHTSWHKGSAGQGPHSLVLSLMPSSFPMQAGLVFHGVGAAVAFPHIRSSHFRPVTSLLPTYPTRSPALAVSSALRTRKISWRPTSWPTSTPQLRESTLSQTWWHRALPTPLKQGKWNEHYCKAVEMFDTLPVSKVWPFKHPPFFFPLSPQMQVKKHGKQNNESDKEIIVFSLLQLPPQPV